MAKGGAPGLPWDGKKEKEYIEASQEDSETPLASLRRNLLASAKRMARAEVDSVLQAEILSSLIEGKRTLAELVEQIYKVGKENPEYQMYYMRVRRAAKNLSSRGLVSAGLIRRDTPYRITKYGVSRLVRIGEPAEEYRMVSRQDYSIFLGSAILLVLILLGLARIWSPGPGGLKMLYSGFFLAAGAGLLRLSQILRNIA